MMENIKIAFTENGTKTLATAGKYCDRNVDIEVEVATGGGGEIEPVVLTGNCSYACSGALASQYIELFGDTISTKDITNFTYMFYLCDLSHIPFELNAVSKMTNADMSYIFYACNKLESIPKINNLPKPQTLNNIFGMCYALKELPEDIEQWIDWSYLDGLVSSPYSGNRASQFYNCKSLRKIPMGFLNHGNPEGTYSVSMYYNGFANCHVLDELVDLPNPQFKATWTSNAFYNTFAGCHRLKNLVFATSDGLPYTVKWKSQVIDLFNYSGWANSWTLITDAGITRDKEVTDDATYQALKDDPDWFTCNAAYSRYNHDSAVATINSLPDTSAYLATAGGTNTIKFKGAAGSKTDGGAINTLTAEEIAVATARGWTVTLV